MKIFVSYQQTWIEEKNLEKDLRKVREIIESMWHITFVYFLDSDYKNQTKKEMVMKTKNEIDTSDIVLSFVEHPNMSEWMMQELGMAYALNKKIVFFVKKEHEQDYFLSYWIATNTVFYDEFHELEKLIKYNLPIYTY